MQTTIDQIKLAAGAAKVSPSALIESLCLSSGGLSKAQEVAAQKLRQGEVKVRKTFTISGVASDKIRKWSYELRMSRSEILECAVRGGGLQDAITTIKK